MNEAIIVFNTDYNHNHSSKKLVGIYNSKSEAIQRLTEAYPISQEQINNLKNMNQTQINSEEEPDYDGEFVLENYTTTYLTESSFHLGPFSNN